MTDPRDRVARAICAETCAFYGEPPCYEAAGDDEGVWPNPDCDEPGCHALAEAAIKLIVEECAKVARDACLVPPDGGSPTEEERLVCDEAARRIRALATKEGEV